MSNKKPSIQKHIDFILLDITSLIVCFFVSYRNRHIGLSITNNELYLRLLLVIIVSNILITIIYEPYKNVLKKHDLNELKTTFIFDVLSISLVVLYLFSFKLGEKYSRLVIGSTYVSYFILSYIVRIIRKKQLKQKSLMALSNRNNKSLFVVCNSNQVENIVDTIKKNNYEFYYIAGICVVDKDLRIKKYKDSNVIAINDLLNYVSTNRVDEIFIANNYLDISKTVLEGLVSIGVPIHVEYKTPIIFDGRPQRIDKLANYDVITTVNIEYDNWQVIIKKIIDLFGGIIGSLLCILLIMVVGPIIYFKSPGNIFYVSNRVGKNGKIFKFYKFRSMVLNADEKKDELRKNNRNKDQMMFKIENDPRIIPGIGSFIRKTSIDEFPQFFNVLKGDMSLVGTRPPTLDEWNKYTPYYRSRMSIKPGITGLWQVSGRSDITDFDEVVKLDNQYINNWSIGLDIRILIKTIKRLFSNDSGAM